MPMTSAIDIDSSMWTVGSLVIVNEEIRAQSIKISTGAGRETMAQLIFAGDFSRGRKEYSWK